MTQGIRIVRENSMISTTDPRQVTLDTRNSGGFKKYSTQFIKLQESNYTSITIGAFSSSGSLTIPHPFKFTPAFDGFLHYTASNLGISLPIIGLTFGATTYMEADESNIYVRNLPTSSEIYEEMWLAIIVYAESLESTTL